MLTGETLCSEVIWELCVLTAQYFCKCKAVLKNSSLLKNKLRYEYYTFFSDVCLDNFL